MNGLIVTVPRALVAYISIPLSIFVDTHSIEEGLTAEATLPFERLAIFSITYHFTKFVLFWFVGTCIPRLFRLHALLLIIISSVIIIIIEVAIAHVSVLLTGYVVGRSRLTLGELYVACLLVRHTSLIIIRRSRSLFEKRGGCGFVVVHQKTNLVVI